MITASLLFLLLADTPRILDPADVRRQLGFSRLCNTPGDAAFLDIVAGDNRPDIELKRPGRSPLFTRGRFASVTMVEHGDRHLAIRVEGQSGGKPADLKLTVLPGDGDAMRVSAVLQPSGTAPRSFTCIAVPPAPPGTKK